MLKTFSSFLYIEKLITREVKKKTRSLPIIPLRQPTGGNFARDYFSYSKKWIQITIQVHILFRKISPRLFDSHIFRITVEFAVAYSLVQLAHKLASTANWEASFVIHRKESTKLHVHHQEPWNNWSLVLHLNWPSLS